MVIVKGSDQIVDSFSKVKKDILSLRKNIGNVGKEVNVLEKVQQKELENVQNSLNNLEKQFELIKEYVVKIKYQDKVFDSIKNQIKLNSDNIEVQSKHLVKQFDDLKKSLMKNLDGKYLPISKFNQQVIRFDDNFKYIIDSVEEVLNNFGKELETKNEEVILKLKRFDEELNKTNVVLEDIDKYKINFVNAVQLKAMVKDNEVKVDNFKQILDNYDKKWKIIDELDDEVDIISRKAATSKELKELKNEIRNFQSDLVKLKSESVQFVKDDKFKKIVDENIKLNREEQKQDIEINKLKEQIFELKKQNNEKNKQINQLVKSVEALNIKTNIKTKKNIIDNEVKIEPKTNKKGIVDKFLDYLVDDDSKENLNINKPVKKVEVFKTVENKDKSESLGTKFTKFLDKMIFYEVPDEPEVKVKYEDIKDVEYGEVKPEVKVSKAIKKTIKKKIIKKPVKKKTEVNKVDEVPVKVKKTRKKKSQYEYSYVVEKKQPHEKFFMRIDKPKN